MQAAKEWLKILIPLFVIGGVGGAGLEYRSAERFADNAEYAGLVSIESLEMELRLNLQITELKERLARLEGTHDK